MNYLSALILSLGLVAAAGADQPRQFDRALEQFHAGEFVNALTSLQRYESAYGADNHRLHIFRGQIHYSLDQFTAAIVHIERGIQLAKAQGQVVEERWWQLLRYLHWEQGDYRNAIATIRSMDKEYPRAVHAEWLRELNALLEES